MLLVQPIQHHSVMTVILIIMEMIHQSANNVKFKIAKFAMMILFDYVTLARLHFLVLMCLIAVKLLTVLNANQIQIVYVMIV